MTVRDGSVFYAATFAAPTPVVLAPVPTPVPDEPKASSNKIVYPITYPPGNHSDLPNKEISLVADWTKIIKQAAGEKPVWMTLQIAWAGTATAGKTLRFPTFPQQRYMAYAAIINGARGVNFQGGGAVATYIVAIDYINQKQYGTRAVSVTQLGQTKLWSAPDHVWTRM